MGTSESELRPTPAVALGWSRLGWDLTAQILSLLPLRSIVASGAVCRQFRSVVADPAFAAVASASRRRRLPWFFIYGRHNILANNNQAFAFDPDAGEWLLLPTSPIHDSLFSGSGGFRFAATSSPTRFSYAPLLRGPWRLTPPLSFSRCNPLIGVYSDLDGGGGFRFVVAGGSRFIGGLVDIEDRLAVEIYDPASDAWELCSPLPAEFRFGNSSQWLSSALLGGIGLFFVSGIYSGFVAAFDLRRREWSGVRSLRPPGILFGYLLAAGDRLVLAGLFATADGPPRFAIWGVDHGTLESAEIGTMPKDLLACLFDSDDDDARFSSLKCVGLEGAVYVFNEDHHKGYPACVCEISAAAEGGGGSATCRWRKVPPLPVQINPFHKVVAFCSAVPLGAVLAPDADVEGGLVQ